MDSSLVLIAGVGLLAYFLYKPQPPSPPPIIPINPITPASPSNNIVPYIVYTKDDSRCSSGYARWNVQTEDVQCISFNDIPVGVNLCDADKGQCF